MAKIGNYSIQQRKEMILLIAEEVFAQYSFAGGTIRLITKRSGVSLAMINYYFGSKENLYLEIFKFRLGDVVKEISRFEAVPLDPVQKLRSYLGAFIERIASRPNFQQVIRSELLNVQHPAIISEVSEARNSIYNFILQVVNDGISKGCFEEIDAEIFALNILALIPSLFTEHLPTPIHLNKSPFGDSALRIVNYIMAIVCLADHNQFKIKSHVS
jgi:AcrR family transcriptional regulator